ncbi:hypothetical protein Lepto7375DRAFT_7270 [Leptolyngbya sp. PCC 7375]|nr:hypothetical protein Lepto7375DRAFT_7270 [Leptolyngbya sp. PCC 7375]
MTYAEREIRNPYYSGNIFTPEEEIELNYSAITIYAKQTIYAQANPAKDEPKWTYSGITNTGEHNMINQ